MNIIETIRIEIRKCPFSRREISRQTGVNPTAIHRVMAKGGKLNAASCDKLLMYFGYELKKKRGRK